MFLLMKSQGRTEKPKLQQQAKSKASLWMSKAFLEKLIYYHSQYVNTIYHTYTTGT
jgi:hypothetical protein